MKRKYGEPYEHLQKDFLLKELTVTKHMLGIVTVPFSTTTKKSLIFWSNML